MYDPRKIIVPVGIALALVSCAKKQEIVIGGVFPLSGNAATFGQSSKQGMQLAVDQVNARGGILVNGIKEPVRALYEDDEGQPEKANNACQKLISRDNVCAINGAVMSKNSLAIAPICQSARVPMVSPASTNIKVTEAGDYIFRACFIDPFQGAVMARYAYHQLGARRAAIIFDNGNDYNKGLAEVFKQKFTQFGGTIVADEAFTDEANTVDFKAQLTSIKAAKPDFLYCPNYYAADAVIMKQAHEIGLVLPVGGGDGWDSPELVAIGKADVEGAVFSNHFSKDDTAAVVRNFVSEYRTTFGADPDALASLAYDAASIIMTAIGQCATLQPEKLRDAIKGLSLKGVTGAITFDQKRNPIKSAVILKIQNGRQVYVTTVAPE
ncbi:MAG: ABC transporter substrate-binding protein [Chitinivibrionales bacterium]|nr:ABC transporter substrate-binding protein [Chitinivibrionales bacterium]